MTPEEARSIAIELQGYGHTVPSPVTLEWVEKSAEAGMIRLADLVPGANYIGCCRNAYIAEWDGEVFWYKRFKPSREKPWFAESINHPERDDGYDVFVPTLMLLGPL